MKFQFNQGDIVLANFPYTDLKDIKKRPVLIISGVWYNNRRQDVIVLPLSSQIPNEPLRDDYILTEEELREGGLQYSSVLKLGKPMTLHKDLIVTVLGTISPNSTKKIMKYFMDVLGFPEFMSI